MRLLFELSFVGLLLIGVLACSDSHQQADPDFKPKNTYKSFTTEKSSPIVFVDEAHNNFLTANGRYGPFVQVLESDGYKVKPNKIHFTLEHLRNADILVVANALDKDRQDWNPPFAEALTKEEVSDLKKWILEGGSLFLVADHTPFPKVIENLTNEFGFEFSHGHVGNAEFHSNNGTLGEHIITLGKVKPEQNMFMAPALIEMPENTIQSGRISHVKSFGGSAFKPPQKAISLLTLGETAFSVVPEVPFQVNANTPRASMNGWSQGAVLEAGKGRLAVFAEGMMFSSQLDTHSGRKYGLVSKGAEQNERFLLNIMSWLARAD